MAKFLPFCGVYYNPEKFGRVDNLLCSPYESVNYYYKNKLKEDVNNFSYLVFPEGNGEKYKNAVNKFFGWLLRDTLILDKKPAFYVVELNRKRNGIDYKNYAIMGIMKLEEEIKKSMDVQEELINEKYNLIKETQTIPEPVSFFYKDKNKEINSKIASFVAGNNPKFESEFMKVNYRFFSIDNEELIKEIKTYFENTSLYLVDGQATYEAALKYMKDKKAEPGAKYSGKEPFNYILSCFINFYDEVVELVPVYRGVKNFGVSINDILKTLSSDFKLALIPFNNSKEEIIARKKLNYLIQENRKKGILSIGFYHKSAINKYLILSYNKQLSMDTNDIDFIDKMLLSKFNGINMSYFYDFDLSFEEVKNSNFEGAFIINGVNKEIIIEKVEKNIKFKANSFCLSPQIPDGLLLFSYRYSSFASE